jgi:hypothetical protein
MLTDVLTYPSSSVYTSGMYSVCPGSAERLHNLIVDRNDVGVGEKEWAFKTTFTASDDDLKAPNADLVFDGLDTFATVTLVRSNTQDQSILTDMQPTEW